MLLSLEGQLTTVYITGPSQNILLYDMQDLIKNSCLFVKVDCTLALTIESTFLNIKKKHAADGVEHFPPDLMKSYGLLEDSNRCS